MRPQSLKNRLLLIVSILVVGSGIAISLLVTQRFSKSLLAAAAAEAEHLAHSLSLEATDKILINDLVSLQKLLEYQMGSNPSISYLFIVNNDRVLSHTFDAGIPAELIDANKAATMNRGNLKRIVSTRGDHFIDIAYPIFSGKAGMLRLGFSEAAYRQEVFNLGLQMSILTLVILLVALSISYLFIRRVTRPLTVLTRIVEDVGEDNLGITVELKGEGEVGRLTASFNRMFDRIRDYTRRLENNADELDRANRQTRSTLALIQEIGAQPTLKAVTSYLMQRFEEILSCQEMQLLVFDLDHQVLDIFPGSDDLPEGDASFSADIEWISRLDKMAFKEMRAFKSTILTRSFSSSARQLSVFPIRHEKQSYGALMIACPKGCGCDKKELDVIEMILTQSAGAIRRAVVNESEIRDLQGRIEVTKGYGGIVGKDSRMQAVYKLIEDIAPTDSSVLISGESGTGKELVARAIHQKSNRNDRPFVVINCSAYPATLLEGELFGHEKGAFTGAVRQKAGRFEQADGGTIFLDEIGEISPSAQIKLLRVIQTQKFERLGGEKTLSVDVRIISASNKELLQEVKTGDFREDLYYRLNVIPIKLPPLRERVNDIPLLSRHFLDRMSTELNKTIDRFSSEAMRQLLEYIWPGNVRELENSIEHAVVLAKGMQIEVSDLPSEIRNAIPVESKGITAESSLKATPTMAENESQLLKEALESCGWNKKETALRLGISRSTLYQKLKKYQIKPTLH